MPKEKIKVVYLLTRCKKAGPINQTLNIIKYLDRTKFEPILVTLFPEVITDSLLDNYKELNIKHYCINSSKYLVLINGKFILKKLLKIIDPDIIHSVGMTPYKLSKKFKKSKHLTTVRNHFFDDYTSKYGTILGKIMATMDLRTIQKSDNIVTCSESLSKIYKEKYNIDLPFVRNGVDIVNYRKTNDDLRLSMRKKLNLPENKIIAIYTGQFLARKNQQFAIEGILSSEYSNQICLVLLGSGKDLNQLKEKYSSHSNIIFVGQTNQVEEYLQAADFYVSTSKSEGMPNGVLEAMSVGLPVILSDILQHKEIFEINEDIGQIYESGNVNSFHTALRKLMHMDLKKTGEVSHKVINEGLNAESMSKEYQKKYIELMS